MNRGHIPFSTKYQGTTKEQIYSDYGLNLVSEQRRMGGGDSDLHIFNGTPQEAQINTPLQRSPSQSQTLNIPRASSYKGLPIIYNAYNQKNNLSFKPPSQDKPSNIYHQQAVFEENNSDVFQYRQQKEYQTSNHGFQTFKQLPPQNNHPSTAHFLPQSSDHFDNSDYRPQEIKRQHNRLDRPEIRFQHNTQNRYLSPPVNIPPNTQIRVIQNNHTQPPLSPRVRYQQPAFSQLQPQIQRVKQQKYQIYQFKQEIDMLRSKNEDLSKKQHFYWQENMNLRQENKRLRDLVTHFQKREKQLLRQKEQFKGQCGNLINRYKDSMVEEFSLLFQRYKLELQKNK